MMAINLTLIYQKGIIWYLRDNKNFRLQILDFRIMSNQYLTVKFINLYNLVFTITKSKI